jgi:hypothetical protein
MFRYRNVVFRFQRAGRLPYDMLSGARGVFIRIDFEPGRPIGILRAAFSVQANSSAPASREPHERPAPMQHQPALGDGEIKPGLVFRWCAFEVKQEWPVDLLDVDATVLHRLDGIG